MIVKFEEDFASLLKEYGTTVTLEYFKLGNLDGPVSDYGTFESLWYDQEKSMSITLNLKGYDTSLDVIYVYYGNLNGELQGLAFTLTEDTSDFCFDNGINYITVFFPEDTTLNLVNKVSSESSIFLEDKTREVGINSFLAREEDVFDDYDLLTKDSYYRYRRNKVSSENITPLFLDRNGEKVYNITTYRHYKSIYIQAINLAGTQNEKILRYYVGSGNDIGITGVVIYDLYRVINGIYTLVDSDIREDIINTTLYQTKLGTDIIVDDDEKSDNYIINQSSKIINFKKELESYTVDFIAGLTFTPEIDDEEYGYIRGQQTIIKSNIIEFITFLRWSAEYSTNVYNESDYIPVLLFDTKAGDNGWTPEDKNPTRRPGTIILYSDYSVNIENIIITSEDESKDIIFNEYFSKKIEDKGYNKNLSKYEYVVTISTKLENDSLKWYPLIGNESSLILMKLRIVGTADEIKFYCVQRFANKLQIVTYIGNSWSTPEKIEFSSSIGLRKYPSNLYITSPVFLEDYSVWEAYYDNSRVILSHERNSIISTETSPTQEYGITAYTKVPCTNAGSMGYLGRITFKRRNSIGGYNNHNWKDVMYCSEPNNISILATTEDPGTEDWNIYPLVDDEVSSQDYPTENFCTNQNGYNFRLYLFNQEGGEVKGFKIHTKESDLSISFENKDEETLFKTYFDINKTVNLAARQGNDNIFTIKITSKGLQESDNTSSWFPRVEGTDKKYYPIPITIRNNDLTLQETFYCAYRPNLKDTIKFYTGSFVEDDKGKIIGFDPTEISEINFLEEDKGSGGNSSEYNKTVYITSTIESEFPYWAVLSKDYEISVKNYGASSITWDNSGQLIYAKDIDVIKAWVTSNYPSFITTYTSRKVLEDIIFDNTVFIRTTSERHVSTLLDLYKDWRNQLVEDETYTLPVKIDAKNPEESLTVLLCNPNGEFVKINEGDFIELDYIGLYKIFVKSDDKFRVSLDATNVRDGFYFYDIDKNLPKENILAIDEGSFDVNNGREICFAYYGWEENTFSVIEQILNTSIHVMNLEDGYSITIPLHRKYYLGYNLVDESYIYNLNTNITLLGSDNISDIFLKGKAITSNFNYLSYLESETVFNKNENREDKSVDILEGDINSKVTFNYGQFSTISGDRYTRGYINTISEISTSAVPGSTLTATYPILPIGEIKIQNPVNFNKKAKTYPVYHLLDCPGINTSIIGNYTADKNITLQYITGETANFFVIPDGEFYNVYYKQYGTSGDEILFTGDEVTVELKNKEKFKIIRVAELDETRKFAYRIEEVSGRNYEWQIDENGDYKTDSEGNKLTAIENMTIGTLRFESYVSKDKFIRDIDGNIKLESKYDQDFVDDKVPRKSTEINIIRLSKANSKSSIDGNMDIISRRGETREYTIHKINQESEVTIPTQDITYVQNLTYNNLTNTVTAIYRNRIAREGYSSGIYSGTTSVTSPSGFSGFVISQNYLNTITKYSVGQPDTNISIKVGTETVSTKNVVQEEWKQGILINGYLYLGEGNKISSTLDYNDLSIAYRIAFVNLPTTTTIKQTEMTKEEYDNARYSSVRKPNLETDIQINGLEKSNIVLGDTLNPDNRSSYNYYGYTLSINLPRNSGMSTLGPYTLYITDGYGNSVSIDIYSEKRSDFEIELFNSWNPNDIDSDGHYIMRYSDVTRALIFSSSGYLRIPKGYVYLWTDAPSDSLPIIESDTDNNTPTIYVDGDITNTKKFDGQSYQMSERIVQTTLLNENTVRENSPTVGRLYRITLYSKINTVSFYGHSWFFDNQYQYNILDWMGHNPYSRTLSIKVNGSSVIKNYMAYYGCCNIQILGPYLTYLSDDGSIIKHVPDFGTEDSSERDGYTSTWTYKGTTFTSNTNYEISYFYDTFKFDDTIYIRYKNSNTKNYIENWSNKYGKNFAKYGYYNGFQLNLKRFEWEPLSSTKSGEYKIITFSHDLYSGNKGLVLISTDSSDTQTEIINSGTESTEITIRKYYNFASENPPSSDWTYIDNTTSSIYIGDPNYRVGILFELESSKFTKSKSTTSNDYIYTLNGAETFSVSEEGDIDAARADAVQFNIKVSLAL